MTIEELNIPILLNKTKKLSYIHELFWFNLWHLYEFPNTDSVSHFKIDKNFGGWIDHDSISTITKGFHGKYDFHHIMKDILNSPEEKTNPQINVPNRSSDNFDVHNCVYKQYNFEY